jgi:ABC-type transporter Mla subunit MlaD
MRTVTQQLASYSYVSDQKFEALKQIVQHQRVNSDTLTQSIKNNEPALVALLNSLLPAEVQLMNLKTSLMLLRHHQISTDLIPWEHAERIWQEI